MPTLYLVATPIGNLEDITLRALRVLHEVGLIAAEDTRKTRRLLSAYEIKTPLTSYYEHNKGKKLVFLLRCLKERDVALVSEAGTPGISDPGYEIIAAALEQDVAVVPIPGASVVVAALAASGLPTAQFLYLGFLPRKQGERRRLLESLLLEQRTIVVFEAPHRLRATLAEVLRTLGDRRIAVCRELTKLHEEIFRGKVSEALDYFAQPRGEFTLIIEGGPRKRGGEAVGVLAKELSYLKNQGMGAKEAVAQVSKTRGLPKKEVYKAWLKLT